jgi:acyl dehydratase
MRMVCAAALVESNSIGSPGLAYVKWENAVRPGDELRLRITVIETRVAQSRPDLGIIRWRWSMFNQRHEPVLELEATSLFDLASHPAANPPI